MSCCWFEWCPCWSSGQAPFGTRVRSTGGSSVSQTWKLLTCVFVQHHTHGDPAAAWSRSAAVAVAATAFMKRRERKERKDNASTDYPGGMFQGRGAYVVVNLLFLFASAIAAAAAAAPIRSPEPRFCLAPLSNSSCCCWCPPPLPDRAHTGSADAPATANAAANPATAAAAAPPALPGP